MPVHCHSAVARPYSLLNQAISLALLQVHYYSEALLTIACICDGVKTPKLQATVIEGFSQGPYVSTWWLEWDSNLLPSGRKEPSIPLSPLSHHTPPLDLLGQDLK